MPTDAIADQVAQAKARYCRAVDEKDWTAFEGMLAPDLSARFVGTDGAETARFDNRAAMIEATRSFLAGAASAHHTHNAEITVISEDEVRAIWAMEDVIRFPERSASGLARLQGYGHYHETWRRFGQTWVLAQMELRRSLLDTVPAANTDQSIKGIQ